MGQGAICQGALCQGAICQAPERDPDYQSRSSREVEDIDLSTIRVSDAKLGVLSCGGTDLPPLDPLEEERGNWFLDGCEEEPIWCEVRPPTPPEPASVTKPVSILPCAERRPSEGRTLAMRSSGQRAPAGPASGAKRPCRRQSPLAWVRRLPRPYQRRSGAVRAVCDAAP